MIFLCTPHRGSYLASFSLAGMVSDFVAVPSNLTQVLAELVLQNHDKLILRSMARLPTSIDNMTPGNPFIKALAELPVAPGIHAHSIIAVTRDGPPELGSDGVVQLRERAPRRRRVGAGRALQPLGAGSARGDRGDPPHPARARAGVREERPRRLAPRAHAQSGYDLGRARFRRGLDDQPRGSDPMRGRERVAHRFAAAPREVCVALGGNRGGFDIAV